MPTPAPDINLSSLQNIITKVRLLTRALSPQQLSDTAITNYINTFVLYDFPQHLRLFDLHETLTFYTQPGVDKYSTNTTVPTDPLYNFNNIYISVNPPAYCAGFQIMFSQDRSQFYAAYPKINSIQSIGVYGDGATTTFSGVINTGGGVVPPTTNQQIHLLQDQVLFDSIDANGNGMSLTDTPYNNVYGYLTTPNTPPNLALTPLLSPSYINYLTGAFQITFPNAPALGVAINSQTVLYTPSRPQSLLFYQDTFILRPVPDQSYRVQVEVYKRPDYLLSGDTPAISQWWQYIAYGAAKKVFEDRMDLDSIQLIMPEYRKQEMLVLRKTIVQNTNERVATIYCDNINTGPDGYGWGGPGGYGSGF